MMIHDIRREAIISGKESSLLPATSKGFLTQSTLTKMSPSPKMKKVKTLESLKGPGSQERAYDNEDLRVTPGVGKKNVVLSRQEIRELLEETITKMKSHNNKEK